MKTAKELKAKCNHLWKRHKWDKETRKYCVRCPAQRNPRAKNANTG